MKWFKFYGQDWLTDVKVMNMQIEDRLCYLTLICLANNDSHPGEVRRCTEDMIIRMTHLHENIYDDEQCEVKRASGCLKRFSDNEMITIDNANDNKVNVIINKFSERQKKNTSAYERLKKYRDKKKGLNKDNNPFSMITDDNT